MSTIERRRRKCKWENEIFHLTKSCIANYSWNTLANRQLTKCFKSAHENRRRKRNLWRKCASEIRYDRRRKETHLNGQFSVKFILLHFGCDIDESRLDCVIQLWCSPLRMSYELWPQRGQWKHVQIDTSVHDCRTSDTLIPLENWRMECEPAATSPSSSHTGAKWNWWAWC